MEKAMDFSEVIDASIERVWEVLHKPAHIVTEGFSKLRIEDDLHWVQTEGEVDTNCTATLHEDTYTVHVVTQNTKYDSEKTDITLRLEEVDGKCKVNVHYVVDTTALLNMLVFKTMGEKLEHHASNVIIKNIKKAVR